MRTPNVIRPRKFGIMALGIALLVLGIVVGALGLMGRSQADYYARKVKLSQGEWIEYATGKKTVEPLNDDDYNFVVAEVQGQRITHCYVAATENRGRLLDKRAVEPEVVRDEAAKTTRYRLRLPFADLAPLKPEKGRLFGFSFLVWDFDPPETGGYYIQSTPGVAAPVNPAKYASFLFD